MKSLLWIILFAAIFSSAFGAVSQPRMQVTVSRGGDQTVDLVDLIESTVSESPVFLVLTPDRPRLGDQVQKWFKRQSIDDVRFERVKLNEVNDMDIKLETGRMELNYSPVIFYIAAGRVFLHNHTGGFFGGKSELRSRREWLRNRAAIKQIDEISAANVTDVLDIKDENRRYLIVLHDSSEENRCRKPSYFSEWLVAFAQSASDIQDVTIVKVDIATDDHSDVRQIRPRNARSQLDRVFSAHLSPVRLQLEHRLSQEVTWGPCPQFILTDNNTYSLFYKNTIDDKPTIKLGRYISKERMMRLGYDLRDFIRKNTERKRQSIKPPLTDTKLQYLSMREEGKRRANDSWLIIIGVSAGLGILVLAMSIFWGLRSSS